MRSGQFSREGLDTPCPSGFTKVCEGSAAVLFPPAMLHGTASTVASAKGDDEGDEGQAVFYNPAQVVNRDLSICAIQLFSNLRRSEPRRRGGTGEAGITILEALSATGLRAIRYFKEIEGIRYIIANDLDSDAVACIRRNCRFNGIPVVAPGVYCNVPIASPPALNQAAVVPNLDDAVDLMHRLGMNQHVRRPPLAPTQETAASDRPQEQQQQMNQRLVMLSDSPSADGRPVATTAVAGTAQGVSVTGVLQQELMDVVDLDPYGTASPFLDAAMGCIKEGGLMLVTSTDSAILCGNYPDTCHAKYNAIPYKGSHCHEMAVRTLLGCVERAANKHKKYIVPLLSLHIDFYIRCFFRVYTQPAEAKLSACKLGYQLQCTHCPAYWVRPMAVTTTRITKAARRATATGGGRGSGVKRGRGGDATLVDGGAATSRHGAGASDRTPAPDRFPTLPPRNENPKVQSLTLRRLPALHYNTGTGDIEEHCYPAKTALATQPSPSGSSGEQKQEQPVKSGYGTCPVCGVGEIALSGPLYAAPTQETAFLSQLSELIAARDSAERVTATARITGLVQVALGELPDCPLFYNLPDIASYVRVRCPPTPRFVAALVRLGYRCSQVHCCAAGLKTDCPPEVLFAVMLRWKKEAQQGTDATGDVDERTAIWGEEERMVAGLASPSLSTKRAPAPPPALLVSAFTPADAVDFTYDPTTDFRGKTTGVAKFVPNAPGWGPKRRHQGALHPAEE